MACLIRMLLDNPLEGYDQVDIFLFEQQSNLPNLIKKIETNDDETTIYFHNQLISKYEAIDSKEYFSIYYPEDGLVKINKSNQKNNFHTICVDSKSKIIYQSKNIPSHHLQIWHMTANELDLIIKYHNTGNGISLDWP